MQIFVKTITREVGSESPIQLTTAKIQDKEKLVHSFLNLPTYLSLCAVFTLIGNVTFSPRVVDSDTNNVKYLPSTNLIFSGKRREDLVLHPRGLLSFQGDETSAMWFSLPSSSFWHDDEDEGACLPIQGLFLKSRSSYIMLSKWISSQATDEGTYLYFPCGFQL